MKFTVLLTLFIAMQIGIIVICLSGLRVVIFRNRPIGALAVLIAVEITSVAALLLGAYGEARWEAFSAPAKLFRQFNSKALSEIERANNPALFAILDAQRPSLQPPDRTQLAEFQQWQKTLRGTLRTTFDLPDMSTEKNVPFTVQSTIQLDGGIARESISISSDDGVQIPAYLFSPGNATKSPAILVVPGHVKEHESGIEQTGILANSYQHAAALRLAEAGFVTLTIELRGFGQLGKAYGTEHRLVAYNAILAGTFYKAIIANDLRHAVNFLQDRAEVDSQRIGITGASYGGEMSVAYAALDPRIKAVVFQAYGGQIGTNPGVAGTRDDQPHYCHIIPGANLLFQQQDVFLLLAPRPTLGIKGSEDRPWDPLFYAALQEGWSNSGKRSNLALTSESGGHEYFVQPAIEFFRKNL
jgi:dienelactone hydrolase